MRAAQRPAGGFAIVEVMVSLLIFAVAVLGLVGLQASASRMDTDARLRAQAAALADELIAAMQATDRGTVATSHGTGGAAFDAWLTARVQAARTGLPNAQATAEFGALPGVPLSVRVTVSWQPAREAGRAATTGERVAVSRRRSHVTVSALYD